MFSKTINKIKQRIRNTRFRNKIREEKKKIFIDTTDNNVKFNKKRKQIKFSLPKIENQFIKDNFKVVIITSFFVVILLIVISLFSPIFNIKKINIELNDKGSNLIDLNIAYKSVDYFRNRNIIVIEKNEIFEQIVNYQKNIIEVDIDKQIFKKQLNIKLTSSKGIFYTIIDGKKYIISENGVFIYTNDKLLKNLSEIKLSLSDKNKEFLEYKKILKEQYLKKILKLKNDLEQNLLGLKVKKIYYFEDEREIHFDINNDTKLIFDINVEDTEEQIKKLIVFSKEHLNLIKINTINYIDLRIPNKIYYCDNESILNCKKNLKLIYDLYE